MRILALSSWWPEPADNGARLRIAHLLRALAQQHEVHLLSLAQEPIEVGQFARLREICTSVRAVPQRSYTPRQTDVISSLWRADPASVRATYNPQYAAAVQACASDHRPDLVIAFELAAAPYARLIRGVPRIFEEVELGVLWEQFACTTIPQRRVRGWLTWSKHRAYMRRLLGSFNACTVVSEREREYVQRIAPQLPIAVLPNGAELVDRSFGDPEPNTLIYPGALSYHANRDAVAHFLSTGFPLIQQAWPNVRLRITGRATPAEQAEFARDGVQFTGYLPDIRPAIARSWAEVVPLRVGGGTRLKVLEALAIGTPVVSTSKGVEGLAVRDGEHVLIADTPADFAAATLRLLDQPALRSQLVAAGQRLIREQYDWRVVGAQLNNLIDQVMLERRWAA